MARDAAAANVGASFVAASGQELSTVPGISEVLEMNWASIGPFIECWLKDTLPNAQIEMPCALRLDGDMYGRTIEAPNALYHKVSPGGFVIVDDYVLKPCAEAVDEFSAQSRIRALLPDPDATVVWWRVAEELARGASG